jgi:siroheme synthase (precorrin-2 oxidase/ferrochelatase)
MLSHEYLDIVGERITTVGGGTVNSARIYKLNETVDSEIHISCEYTLEKTELEQWKECGLKSLFLLKELERMGARKYDNLEPMIDMIQDIKLPECTELDKEQAGIPSIFTNTT